MVDKSTEPSDIWMHPFTEEIDRKLKPIKSEIKKLKKAQPEVVTELKQELLTTQRYLANFIIINTASFMAKNLPKNAPNIFTQVATDASTARTKALNSTDPLAIATKFYDSCCATLEKSGIPIIKF